MSPFEIERRLYKCRHLQQIDLDRLVAREVPKEALWSPDCVAKSAVIFHADRSLFDFADEVNDQSGAGDAYLILARNQFGDAADLVAWQPRSGNVAVWLGRA